MKDTIHKSKLLGVVAELEKEQKKWLKISETRKEYENEVFDQGKASGFINAAHLIEKRFNLKKMRV